MVPDPVLFSFALVTFGAILFLIIYYILTLADLECDYINAQECCNRLNFWVIPKFASHAILCFFILLGGHWMLFLLNAPMIGWLGYELYRLSPANLGVYDPVDIHGRGLIKVHLRNCMIYLGYYMVMFFIYLYCMISSLLKGDPIRRHENDEIVNEF